jgi:hypothetical protein
MKNLRTPFVCLCAILISLCSFAQTEKDPINEPDYKKPKLFSNLPDRIPVSIEKINDLLNTTIGNTTSLKVAEGTAQQFDGEVISKATKYENRIQSIVIRSTNFNGARLSISKITKEDNTVVYTGRIISFEHGDLYELQNLSGQLTLVKKNFYDLVNE